jgi:hypothetical protein
VVTGLDLIPFGSVRQLRRSRPHCRCRCPLGCRRRPGLTARSHSRAPSPLSYPNWPPSTCMRRASTWGLKRMMWRCPPVTIPSRCAALARTRLTESAWPTGWPRAGSRRWPWNRPGSMGSRCLNFWRPGALRCCWCAMKLIDGMRGNLLWVYQEPSEPLGLSEAERSALVSRMPLKGTGEARGKPPRRQAWLSNRMVSSNEAGFNLRGTSPLSQNFARWDSERESGHA